MPGSLGKIEDFRRQFVNTEMVTREEIEDLKLKMKPLLLRRTKKEILDQLPEKQETKIVRNFFRYEDKATAAEIVDNSEQKGVQYEKELEYAHVDSYKDGLTEEDIIEWKKQRKSGKKEGTSDNKPSAGFGQKRTFSKKTA